MKRHIGLNIASIICGLFFASVAISHPYNSQLIFREHTTDDGRVIWTNIPKKCFSNGLLTCTNLHPIFPVTERVKNSDPKVQEPQR
jgi:hypothetical protein